MPSHICLTCTTKLKDAYLFKNQVEQSEMLLRKKLCEKLQSENMFKVEAKENHNIFTKESIANTHISNHVKMEKDNRSKSNPLKNNTNSNSFL